MNLTIPHFLAEMPALQGAAFGLGVFGAIILGVWAVFWMIDPNRKR